MDYARLKVALLDVITKLDGLERYTQGDVARRALKEASEPKCGKGHAPFLCVLAPGHESCCSTDGAPSAQPKYDAAQRPIRGHIGLMPDGRLEPWFPVCGACGAKAGDDCRTGDEIIRAFASISKIDVEQSIRYQLDAARLAAGKFYVYITGSIEDEGECAVHLSLQSAIDEAVASLESDLNACEEAEVSRLHALRLTLKTVRSWGHVVTQNDRPYYAGDLVIRRKSVQ